MNPYPHRKPSEHRKALTRRLAWIEGKLERGEGHVIHLRDEANAVRWALDQLGLLDEPAVEEQEAKRVASRLEQRANTAQRLRRAIGALRDIQRVGVDAILKDLEG